MRTIKFRGKRIDNGQWVYGKNIQFQIDGTDRVCISENASQRWLDPDTVGQFTGLYDKNDKEIYEGDIISLNPRNSRTLKVYWNDRMCNFLLVNDDTVIDMYKDDENHYKVIGNIYDNKELLTQN